MKLTRRIRLFGFVAMFILALGGIAAPAQAAYAPAQTSPALQGAGKITICHHPPGQPAEVYNYQSVSTSTVFGGNGHDSHPGDVVPAFEGYNGSAKYREDPARYDLFIANGCSDIPPTTSPAPTPCPTTDTPTPTPTTDTPTPSPTTDTPTPSPTTDTPTPSPTTDTPTTGAPTTDTPTTGAPTTGAPTTGAPTTGAPTTGPTTGTATQGGPGGGGAGGTNAAGGGGAANCTCPDVAAAVSAAAAAGQPASIGPDGSVVDPVSGNTVRPCPQALADTGLEAGGFPPAMLALAVGALMAGAAALAVTFIPRGRHG